MRKLSEDERYMRQAITLAKKAAANGDVPIGCMIVYEGKVIARGYNRRNVDKTTLAHAEIMAIKKAYLAPRRIRESKLAPQFCAENVAMAKPIAISG